MNVSFVCPNCRQAVQARIELAAEIECPRCSWSRPLERGESQAVAPNVCLICGCHDLWRQKDFPQRLGLALVALGAGLSTWAWALYMPLVAMGVLLAFAFADMLLYTFMPDVLVCYRCSARHRETGASEHAGFNLETAERYRQEAARLAQAGHPVGPRD